MSHASIPADVRAARGLPDDLIRISAGIESTEDLIAGQVLLPLLLLQSTTHTRMALCLRQASLKLVTGSVAGSNTATCGPMQVNCAVLHSFEIWF